jgi:hypothetical protein
MTLQYCRGNKQEYGKDVVKFFEPLESNATCLDEILVITALRHGRVSSCTSVEELLSTASARTDGKVVWKYPREPVLFGQGSYYAMREAGEGKHDL